ncbi:MAG: RNA methyltransferase [Alphaproteobacteria bacterium]|nr:RNA methyltransferase [Alphaproteobacteria bacterium]
MSAADDIAIVLVRPQLAENVGMAARAMANCGLSSLRLVSPRSALTGEALRRARAAAGRGGGVAGEILDAAGSFDSLADALADRHEVWATSARRRDFRQVVCAPEAAAAEIRAFCGAGRACAILFGPERTGLENDESVRAGRVIRFPLAEGARSLNLAQAVLLVSWCLWRSGDGAGSDAFDSGEEPVCRGVLDGFLARLDGDLRDCGYYPPTPTADVMRRTLEGFFARAGLTEQEVRSFEGVLRALAERRAVRRQSGSN